MFNHAWFSCEYHSNQTFTKYKQLHIFTMNKQLHTHTTKDQ